MPTVRLEFELDSEVYPELHAALSALSSSRARAERMRQLAAAGLVWEKVRLHGAAATAVPPPAEERPAIVARADVAPLPPATAEAPRPRSRRARPGRQEIEQVMRELPVLVDVVADVRAAPELQDDPYAPAVDAPATWSAMNAYPDDLMAPAHPPAALEGGDDDALQIPEAALHVTALSHKPATRSRLMRMKERGLFKNG
jgi:hypothetical protein